MSIAGWLDNCRLKQKSSGNRHKPKLIFLLAARLSWIGNERNVTKYIKKRNISQSLNDVMSTKKRNLTKRLKHFLVGFTARLTSDFERQPILVHNELRKLFVHRIVDSVASGTSTDSYNLIANLQPFQVSLTSFHDIRHKEAGPVLAPTTQREAVWWEGWMTEGEIITISCVRTRKSDGANFGHCTMVWI